MNYFLRENLSVYNAVQNKLAISGRCTKRKFFENKSLAWGNKKIINETLPFYKPIIDLDKLFEIERLFFIDKWKLRNNQNHWNKNKNKKKYKKCFKKNNNN